MTLATILLANERYMSEFYFTSDPVTVARRLMAENQYRTSPRTLSVSSAKNAGREIAEEAFDLTNNPSRQSEREKLYGHGRSISVGDIVNVDGQNFLCANVGWIKF